MRFETLIDLYHGEIYRDLWRLMDGEVEAEDLTQDVFMRAYQAFEHLRPDSNYRAWLYKIATNCAYTALKRGRRHAEHNAPLLDTADWADPGPLPDHQVALGETLAAVRQAIDALPPRQRTAIILRHIQGLDYAEMAQVMNSSEDSARANVYQGLRGLRRALGAQAAPIDGQGQGEKW